MNNILIIAGVVVWLILGWVGTRGMLNLKAMAKHDPMGSVFMVLLGPISLGIFIYFIRVFTKFGIDVLERENSEWI